MTSATQDNPATISLAAIENEATTPSPALLVYPDKVDENLRRMIAMVGGDPSRLRPHIKTHKLPQIVARQVELGITKCKAATVAEAEMAARAGRWRSPSRPSRSVRTSAG